MPFFNGDVDRALHRRQIARTDGGARGIVEVEYRQRQLQFIAALRQLAGEAIPLPARLMAVADVFDALTGPRPYKTCWPVAEALAYIHARAGQQFDPVVCQALGGCEADFAAVADRLRR